jgi:hypothetical protein
MTDAQARLKADIAEEIRAHELCSGADATMNLHKDLADRILALLPRTPDAQPSSKLSLDTPIGNSSAHGGRKEKLTLGDWLREDNRTTQYRARQLALQLIEQQAHDLKAASQLSSETRPHQEEGRLVPITASGPMPISGEINYGPVTQPSSPGDDPLGDGSDLGVTGEWWGTASSTDEVERAFAAGFGACCAHHLLPTGPNNRDILNHELEKFRAIAAMVKKP